MIRATWFLSAAMAAVLTVLVGAAAAEDLGTFSETLINQFAPANSTDTVAPGTKITTANWQQYAKFMPISLQAFMSGKFFWRMGNDPGDYMEVAATPTSTVTNSQAASKKKNGGAPHTPPPPPRRIKKKKKPRGLPPPP